MLSFSHQVCNFLEWRDYKLCYKRYARLCRRFVKVCDRLCLFGCRVSACLVFFPEAGPRCRLGEFSFSALNLLGSLVWFCCKQSARDSTGCGWILDTTSDSSKGFIRRMQDPSPRLCRASLFFIACVENTDNELLALETAGTQHAGELQ